MLDERKVRMMTKLALYEQTQGKEDLPISEYYRKDYVGMHVFSSIVFVTIGYICIVLLALCAGLNAIMASISNSMIMMLGLVVVVGYFGVLIIFGIVEGSMAGKKYRNAKRRVRQYNQDLVRLLKWYKRKENR